MEFFDIFPGLECDENVRKTLGNLNVDNVTKVLAGHFLRIRTHSYIPVPDEYIEYAERLISNSLLNGQLDVRIENTEKGRDESPEETSDESIEEAPETFYGTDEDYEYVSISEISRAAEKDGYAPGGGVSSAPGKNKERKYGPRKKTAADPGMLYGKSFEGETTGISDILTEMREVVIDGEICDAGLTVTKNGVKILKVDVTDYKDTITIKMFLAEGEEHLPEVLSPGLRVRVCGKVEYDNFEGELMISRVKGIKAVKEPLRERKDESPEKRVELHLHTKFSDMDATTDISHVLKRAVEWGHRAVAITDHGVVQGFPPAFNELKEIRKRNEGIDFKIIYGVEGYLVDDSDNPVLKDMEEDVELLRMQDDGTINYSGPELEEAITGACKKQSHHIILLAANDVGRVNLYKLISFSHINYFSRRPRIPRSVLNRYREGLIVGSACVSGELMDAILEGADESRLKKIVDFYDYLEIQPIGNNAFLIRNYENNIRGHKVKDVEGLQELNRQVCRLGERYGKMVAATGDVHFLDPEDEIFRRIILDAQNYEDANKQVPLYYRTTEEMLAEFAYLGEEKAREVVIVNTNLIADMVEDISPVRPDKCPPVIEDSDKKLSDMVYDNANKMYGDPLPDIVSTRLERELNSIISNGYAVLYIIAMELVTQSVRDGYLVGSRGSVGSSLVATMANITEVNPLKPHYRCEGCLYSEFDSPEVNAFAGGAGCDMPDKLCPVCGKPLLKDGFDIPFETFMGFEGDKEPDIDLNFSGEYQARAHAYTETLFGQGRTFRAGTISGLKDKTIYGFVRKYAEKHGISMRKSEINRIIRGCAGVKRSTGQHPGGIVVLPHGEEIYSFTPIQHPANDAAKDIITTHFEYHSIDHNLLKLDELGHDDPTMIKMLEDLSGFPAGEIKFDDQNVMKLFHSIETLGVTAADVDGYELGSLGVPEFGTDFVMEMLKDTKPQNFSDLVRIAGLSHGTDVWINNAQTLVREGKATLSTCICTRDDIMTYLMSMGLEPSMAFDIMENVRRGKVAAGAVNKQWEKWSKIMKKHGVPDWYLWSCNRIQYMFPKAHAVAYVMMAFRIAYYKIFYPLAYYAAYFSIRASSFNYELMCMGREKLVEQMDIIKARTARGESTPKDEATLKDMRSVLEMYARGFEFLPIDLYKASANRFRMIDGKIMPAFTSIDGMGDKAAEALEQAAASGKFNSREDLKIRTRIPSTMIDKLYRLGILGQMPESSQISFSDLFEM